MAVMALLATVLLLAAVAVGLGGCGQEEPRLPFACLEAGRGGYERALRAAPGTVELEGGVPISECLRRVRNDAQLQTLGAVLFRVADDLALRARDKRDVRAAQRLGYFVGAVRRGAAKSNGISSELARRVERAGLKVAGAPGLERAVQQGLEAGVARG